MATQSYHGNLPEIDLQLLNINPADATSCKLLMLIEGVYGIGVKRSIEKYGYTEQRYYQLLKAFRQSGSQALLDKKPGPRQNSRRTEQIVQQIIRLRFLDPDAPAAVIMQKLRQQNHVISLLSVERTIQEYGLQKKTLPVKSR
ncbi:helix-turn-helix domain-containing protein [Foetidibacter luteolus]|uniref:helix-turn-helix domain-containing protein n=1 Tax=Foetidibacter luteolus TaxID=2608880 RepID=UPI00129B7703|nr:helix-turn-helix domain-containing protein [Foetidibacter luteolus]